MKDMMDSCVNGVIELIEDQVTKIRKGKNRRVKVGCDVIIHTYRRH